MATAAKRTFPAWHETLVAGLEECALGYDDKRTVIEVHPLDDFYFAGVVALEASKIRQLFSDEQAGDLLSIIGEQVDAVAGRKDRVVSDLVFSIIGKVDLANSVFSPLEKILYRHLSQLGLGLGCNAGAREGVALLQESSSKGTLSTRSPC